jgi:hydrogenase maturation protease
MPNSPAEVHEPGAVQPASGLRTLVAGVGNLFLGDDGFGAEVARVLQAHELPAGVTVRDYGIRAMHLAYDLLDGWDRLILLDVLPARGRPGAVHIVRLDPDENPSGTTSPAPTSVDPHGMVPHAVLAGVLSLGGRLPPAILVGCEPADLSESIGLSAPVAAAVQPAADAVLALLSEVPATEGRH